jgi:undecaprenyl diphosphate synthase
VQDLKFKRLPRHIGLIPDGNRRWAVGRRLPRSDGYAAGIPPGLALLQLCRRLGIEEASVYGFTKENVRRPSEQVEAFREACIEFATHAVEMGAALRVVGDTRSDVFPAALRPWAEERSEGDIRVNLLVNYGWQWDLHTAIGNGARGDAPVRISDVPRSLGSGDVSRVDLVVRWGGRRRLSGFLPVQCAYADLYVVESFWPDMRPEEFLDALRWYEAQDVTLGG